MVSKGIRDPRGMMGSDLKCVAFFIQDLVQSCTICVKPLNVGLQVENIIISPLAMIKTVLNEGEREFGATVIDMGGGQTTVASVRSQELQFTNIYQEGGDYVTKDISKVLKTSQNWQKA